MLSTISPDTHPHVCGSRVTRVTCLIIELIKHIVMYVSVCTTESCVRACEYVGLMLKVKVDTYHHHTHYVYYNHNYRYNSLKLIARMCCCCRRYRQFDQSFLFILSILVVLNLKATTIFRISKTNVNYYNIILTVPVLYDQLIRPKFVS